MHKMHKKKQLVPAGINQFSTPLPKASLFLSHCSKGRKTSTLETTLIHFVSSHYLLTSESCNCKSNDISLKIRRCAHWDR